jgi:long-chain fatty acid transport protein
MYNAPRSSAGFALRPLAVALVLGGSLTSAFATNGYFSHGYGMKAKGMGGASVAMTDNAFAGANNPAVAAWAGNRVEVGVDVFMPKRGMERTGGAALGAIAVDSDSNTFYVPEFGYNRAISKNLGVGITVYGNGGMNTDYAGGQVDCSAFPGGGPGSNVLCGAGRLGVNLEQLIIAPTIAYKVSDSHSFGVSPLIVKQTFKADGLHAFTDPTKTSNSAAVTNNGNDTSNGYGIRLGYLGKVSDSLNVGVSYSPKISMSKFSQYAGLFAEAGSFDIPAEFTVGFSFQATPDITIAADYQSIKYGSVPAIANPSNAAFQLGTANGPGFGWSDVNVVKIGVQWRASQKLTMRAGVNVGDNPVKSNDVTFNILAPGVVTTHYTVGGTYAMSDKSEVTLSYMLAPSNSVTGTSLYTSAFAGNETVKMNQQAIGIQFGWKF